MTVASEQVAGILLAGGQSRRMGGGDKCLRPLGGRPLLAHVCERLRPQVGPLALNANGDPSRFAEFGLPVFADSVEGFAGPLAGVLSGMIWARMTAPDVRFIVTVATDTPFFPLDLVSQLLEAAADDYPVIVLASSLGQVHPVFGLWPVSLAEDLDMALREGTRKVLAWTDRHDQREAEFPILNIGGREIDPFFNANSPEDLSVADELLEKLI